MPNSRTKSDEEHFESLSSAMLVCKMEYCPSNVEAIDVLQANMIPLP